MALPKLNNSPKYDLVIPSSQQKIRFRPYLVKEEKILMLAMESEDQKQIFEAIADTIEACCDGDVDKRKLTTFDIEYMFVQLRSKSVGESITLNLKCAECDHSNENVVKVDDIQMTVPKVDMKLDITNDISIEMMWPPYTAILDDNILEGTSETEQTFKLLSKCINAVLTDDERIVFKDESEKDQMEFIESLNTEQFNKIRGVLEKMPTMQHTIEYKCTKCEHDNSVTLRGMSDFF